MKWLNNFKLGTKLIASFMVVALIAGLIGYIGIKNIKEIDKRDSELYRVNTAPLNQISNVAILYQRMRVDLRDIVITHDVKYRDRIYDLDNQMNEHLDAFEKNIPSDDVRQEFNKLKTKLDKYAPLRDQIISLALDNKNNEAMALMYEGNGYKLVLEIDSSIQKIKKIKVEQAGQKAETNASSAARAEKTMIILILMGVGFAIGLGVLITRDIVQNMKLAVNVAQQISEKDLSVDVIVDERKDEVGTMLKTFRTMVANLRKEITQIKDGVSVLLTATNNISASTVEFASTASETAAAVTETTTTMEEVKQTAQISSQKANYVSEIAQKAVQVSQTGQKSVDGTVQGMHRIKEKMELIADGIIRLSEQSQAIGEIISSVDDIAEQSNLLAVNASIEATKAGEQGIGFIVVAQEIKNLAEQSKQATAQVRSILNEIQKATSSAVMATEQGSKVVEDGVRQSVEAGESIRMMTKTISEAAQSVVQIANSLEQQFVGVDQVTLAMENIQQASSQNADGAKQLDITTRNLGELGRNLKQLVDGYKF